MRVFFFACEVTSNSTAINIVKNRKELTERNFMHQEHFGDARMHSLQLVCALHVFCSSSSFWQTARNISYTLTRRNYLRTVLLYTC